MPAAAAGRWSTESCSCPSNGAPTPERREQAGIDPTVRFATKPMLALAMVERALDAGMRAGWVAADEVYGQDSKFRLGLQKRRVGYVLAVPCSQKIPTETGAARADALAAAAPQLAWKRRSCGDGAKGPRLYDWAVATLPDTGIAAYGFSRWLLIRRSITNPADVAYYLCYGSTGTSDEQLIRVAGTWWAIEECFQTAKGQVGLDEYQVRRYRPWYRRITLAMCAHAFLSLTAAVTAERGHRSDRDGLIPLTLAEVRRLLAHVITGVRSLASIHRWSRWRRRHQHRARISHYQRRLHQC